MKQYSRLNNVMEAGYHFKNGASSKSLMSRGNLLKRRVLNVRAVKIIGILLVFAFQLNAQGTNNNFDYDKDDFNVIFKELGITTFKFPIKQGTDQLLNIVLEEYENKELIKKVSVIDDVKQSFGQIGINGLSYFKPENDSTYFHRFYFFKNDSTMKIRMKTHGIELEKVFNFEGKSLYSINTDGSIGDELRKNQYIAFKNENSILLYLYANSLNEKDKPLWCPNGLSKEQLLERFYYFVFISVEPYKEE